MFVEIAEAVRSVREISKNYAKVSKKKMEKKEIFKERQIN